MSGMPPKPTKLSRSPWRQGLPLPRPVYATLPRDWMCFFCPARFSDESQLMRHTREEHSRSAGA